MFPLHQITRWCFKLRRKEWCWHWWRLYAARPTNTSIVSIGKTGLWTRKRTRKLTCEQVMHHFLVGASRLSALALTMMYAGKLTYTPLCHGLSLRLLRHPWSLHIHSKRTSMCGFSLNPPPPPPPLKRWSWKNNLGRGVNHGNTVMTRSLVAVAPRPSYDRRRHRNCFPTRPAQAFPKK